jgi:hypothetical protein
VAALSVVGGVFLAALAVAAAGEVCLGLPLFLLFRRLGWLSPAAFLVGGLVVSFAGCLVVKWNSSFIPFTVWLGYAVPGLVGGLVFGYVGGWLPNQSLQRTLPSARRHRE